MSEIFEKYSRDASAPEPTGNESNQSEYLSFSLQTIYSDENVSLPGGVDRNVYVPTGIYKVRPY